MRGRERKIPVDRPQSLWPALSLFRRTRTDVTSVRPDGGRNSRTRVGSYITRRDVYDACAQQCRSRLPAVYHGVYGPCARIMIERRAVIITTRRTCTSKKHDIATIFIYFFFFPRGGGRDTTRVRRPGCRARLATSLPILSPRRRKLDSLTAVPRPRKRFSLRPEDGRGERLIDGRMTTTSDVSTDV